MKELADKLLGNRHRGIPGFDSIFTAKCVWSNCVDGVKVCIVIEGKAYLVCNKHRSYLSSVTAVNKVAKQVIDYASVGNPHKTCFVRIYKLLADTKLHQCQEEGKSSLTLKDDTIKLDPKYVVNEFSRFSFDQDQLGFVFHKNEQEWKVILYAI